MAKPTAAEINEQAIFDAFDAEAGDYIEDDPRTWEALLHAVRRYAPEYSSLATHFGDSELAVSVTASAMLAYLADVHGVYLRRERVE